MQTQKTHSEKIKNLWQNPEYRQKMIEKQKKLGYRTYGRGLFYSTNKTRRLSK